MNEITAFDIYDYLPEKIKELLFNQTMDDLMESIFAIANIPADKQTLLHRDIVSVLIGKYSIEECESILKNSYGLNSSMTATVMGILKTKLFDLVKSDIAKSRMIFQQAKDGNLFNNDLQPKETIKPPEQLMSYIKNLASTMKTDNIEPEIKKEENIKLPEKKVEPVVLQTNKNNVEIKVPEIQKIDESEKTNSLLLKAMKQREVNSESKLTEYYKMLKDNLDTKTEEKENVFQPPFRSVKGKGALVESSFDNLENTNSPFVNKAFEKKNNENADEETKISPVKYNSFDYTKKEKEETNIPKVDDKFVDLGDF